MGRLSRRRLLALGSGVAGTVLSGCNWPAADDGSRSTEMTPTDLPPACADEGTQTDLTLAGGWPMHRATPEKTGVADHLEGPDLGATEEFVEWPIFHSDYVSGPTVVDDVIYVSDEETTYAMEAESEAGIHWRAPVARAGMPTVTEETVYVSTEGQGTTALDRETGAVKWRALRGSESGTPVPAASADVLVVATDDGQVHGLDTTCGEVEWTTDLPTSRGGYTAIENGTVYVSPGSKLVALSAEDGSERWRWTEPTDAHLSYSPVAVGDTVVVLTAQRIYAIDAADGRKLWEFSRLAENGIHAAPVVSQSAIFVVVGQGRYATAIHSIDLASGEERWHQQARSLTIPSISIHQNRLLVPGSEQILARDFGDGRVRERAEMPIDMWQPLSEFAVSNEALFAKTGRERTDRLTMYKPKVH